MSSIILSEGALALFLAYANDAPNWRGVPPVGGNVNQGPAENGYLTDLKKRGLLTTYRDEGNTWIQFTPAGKALAAQHNCSVE